MAATLKLEIVTPEEKIYSEDVNMVTLPGSEGELGVYPNHVPLLTALKPGELRVVKDGRETAMAVGEGFIEIKADGVSVLTDMALQSEKIDIEAAEKAVASTKSIARSCPDRSRRRICSLYGRMCKRSSFLPNLNSATLNHCSARSLTSWPKPMFISCRPQLSWKMILPPKV